MPDPSIPEQLEQATAVLGAMVDNSPVGCAFLDPHLRYVRVNITLAEMNGIPLHEHPGLTLQEVVPGLADQLEPLLHKVIETGQPAVNLEVSCPAAAPGEVRHSLVSAFPVQSTTGTFVGLAVFVLENTQHKRAEQALHDNQIMLKRLFESAPDAIVVVDVQGHIQRLNAQVKTHFGYEREELLGQAVEVLIPQRFSRHLEHREEYSQAAVARPMGAGLELYAKRKDGSEFPVDVMLSPMGLEGLVIATVRDVTQHKRLEAERELLLAQAQESEREALLLAQIASSLSLADPLGANLSQIASLIVKATDAVSCTIRLYNRESNHLQISCSHNQPEGLEAAFHQAIEAGLEVPAVQAIRRREMYIEHHFRQQALADPQYAVLHPVLQHVEWDTIVAAPLLQHKQVLGAILFCYPLQHEPTTTDLLLLSTLTSQVALVLENARLFAEASAKAALEERQKLARELHDSVSQALYGISLGLQSATLSIRSQQPESSEADLAYARQMTETAIAEMKALIFELRPESLEQEGLVASLQKHLRAAELRHQLEFDLHLNDEPPLSPSAKEVLYRIAQEAINNAIRHAGTKRIRMKMTINPDQVKLEIGDEGIGFEPTQTFPGHLGLRSMRERAELLGGSLDIQSSPGGGTLVRVSLPVV